MSEIVGDIGVSILDPNPELPYSDHFWDVMAATPLHRNDDTGMLMFMCAGTVVAVVWTFFTNPGPLLAGDRQTMILLAGELEADQVRTTFTQLEDALIFEGTGIRVIQ